MHKCQPVYKTLIVLKEEISQVKSYMELPEKTRAYIEEIENLVNIPVSMISVGPERNQIIIRDESIKTRIFNINRKPLLVL
jgi:adenylosuccinate synthase